MREEPVKPGCSMTTHRRMEFGSTVVSSMVGGRTVDGRVGTVVGRIVIGRAVGSRSVVGRTVVGRKVDNIQCLLDNVVSYGQI
jgi:hypothetical protein